MAYERAAHSSFAFFLCFAFLNFYFLDDVILFCTTSSQRSFVTEIHYHNSKLLFIFTFIPAAENQRLSSRCQKATPRLYCYSRTSSPNLQDPIWVCAASRHSTLTVSPSHRPLSVSSQLFGGRYAGQRAAVWGCGTFPGHSITVAFLHFLLPQDILCFHLRLLYTL